MSTYNDKNLVKYKDAIKLHLSWASRYGWLTLSNYGGVIDEASEDVVITRVVGKKDLPAEKNYLFEISISEMLDVIEVIKFQKYIFQEYLNKIKGTPIFLDARTDLPKLIGAALDHIGVLGAKKMFIKETESPVVMFWSQLRRLLAVPPGALTIMDQIGKYELLGFTAYFPKPSLIVQEQRTADLWPSPNGQTVLRDVRPIDPILANITVPAKFALQEFLEEVDDDIRDKYPEVFAEQGDVFGERKNLSENEKKEAEKYLHYGLQRICCFAFRGDTRALEQICAKKKSLGGFLPGVTRTRKDEKLADAFKKEGDNIDRLAYPTKAKNDEFWGDMFRFVRHKKYKKTMRGKFDLEEYVKDEKFKGYISTSMSIAIAKAFTNYYEADRLTAYLYAVRCRGGFHLSSYLQDVTTDTSDEKIKEGLQKKHRFNQKPEQEVAVPGAIWWEDVVGMRVLKINKKGQFFFGPVFLQDVLKEGDHQWGKIEGSDTGSDTKSIDSTRLLVVTPRSTQIAPGESVQFTAAMQNTKNPHVSWTVDGVVEGNENVGYISKDGLYTAPSKDHQHWFTVTAAAFATEANWMFYPRAKFKPDPDDPNSKPPATFAEFRKLPYRDQIYGATAAVNVTTSPIVVKPPEQRWRSGIADNAGFSALFELLSGKSQGEGVGILKSYPDGPPWEVGPSDDSAKKAGEAARNRWVQK